MHVPVILYVEVWSQILPSLAILARRNRARPVVIIALAYLGAWVTDEIGRYVARQTGNNMWVSALSAGLMLVVLLVALAEWQVSPVERLTVRIAVIPSLIAYGILAVFVDDLLKFSRFAYPFYLLVILGVTTWTLLRRAYQHPGRGIVGTDWFLILSGIALIAATTAVATPIGAILMGEQRVDLFFQLWAFRAGVTTVGILLITAGTLRPASEPLA